MTKRFKAPALAGMMTAVLAATPLAAEEGKGSLMCEPGETYIMNVMVSAHPYWVPVYEAFHQAAEAFGCETVFSGTPDYDISKQIASFEQDVVRQPAGVLLHPMQSDPFIEPINQAMAQGIEVVTFAADSPLSDRTAYITSDNHAEAKFAAEEIVAQRGEAGEYAVLENPGQSNHDLRVTSLIDYMEANHPDWKLVGRQATNQDSTAAYRAMSSIVQANPELDAVWIPEAGSAEGAVAAIQEAGADVLVMHADITPTMLEHIRAGNVHMALNPNQGIQGFMGFVALHLANNAEVFEPFNDYKTSGYNPFQIPFMDNGFAVITKENADDFDLNAYMDGR
ncbi:substrate-binding domain-containing protein [Chachezhania antarctica]|uniref:substrate-binding domain-containing protein n=1 Tax=Chachezhania antarctica TaxID=2340860 RepID=UPI000EB39405|nr:substrate-binding domain-containing protein [Chachezhania antarctica]|tara:strand:+ start:1809 stop:2822 length:1014 start_codon:yes stop_codon:yes gene_type:complete